LSHTFVREVITKSMQLHASVFGTLNFNRRSLHFFTKLALGPKNW